MSEPRAAVAAGDPADLVEPLHPVDPADVLTQLVDEVFRLADALAAAGDALTAPSGLSAARWLVLGALVDQPLTIAQVAARRGLRRQSARESVQRIKRDGLVTRATNHADARAALLHLTARGRDALEHIEPRRRAWSQHTSAAIDTADLLSTLTTLRQLRDHLHASATTDEPDHPPTATEAPRGSA